MESHSDHLPNSSCCFLEDRQWDTHDFFLTTIGHFLPPAHGCTMISLDWIIWAWPFQFVGPAIHLPQSATMQSTGQRLGLHSRVPTKAGHLAPDLSWRTCTVRERLCSPEPHDAEQVDQCPQRDTRQLTGHGPASHSRVSCLCLLHAAPPCVASVITILLLLLRPLKHV